MIRLGLASAALASMLVLASGAAGTVSAAKGGSGGVSPGAAFLVDGVPYRTVGTPTDFTKTGAPEQSFDVIYEFSGLQMNVATAAPGDREYNGGRWRVHLLEFSDYQGALDDDGVDANHNNVLDSDEEIDAAIDAGYASDAGVVKSFECPVIRMPASRT